MKNFKLLCVLLALVLMSVSVFAQPELHDPGITPDSPFYFLDRMFDRFQSAESVADERASEIVAMAQTANAKGLEKAREGYEKAMQKRQQEAEKDEDSAEKVAKQSSNHLAVLVQVKEQVSEQARSGIDQAIAQSTKGRENALQTLNKTNPERAGAVAESTLQEIIANAPEAAQEGLQKALKSVKEKIPGPAQSGKVEENSSQKAEDAPEETGNSSEIPAGKKETEEPEE